LNGIQDIIEIIENSWWDVGAFAALFIYKVGGTLVLLLLYSFIR